MKLSKLIQEIKLISNKIEVKLYSGLGDEESLYRSVKTINTKVLLGYFIKDKFIILTNTEGYRDIMIRYVERLQIPFDVTGPNIVVNASFVKVVE